MRRPAQICQVPGCNADLTNLRSYFVRQHICEEHARADAVPDGRGGFLRFCQQCTKLEPVAAFEGLKRSCEASLQKRHLRRSGGAAAAQRAKSGSSGGMALNAAAFNAAANSNAGMLGLPHMLLPSAQANHAASAAAMAAMLAGTTGDRGSPCSTGSLQQPATTTRSTSGLRGGGAAGAANPLAALLEAALPGGGGTDLGAGGPIPIADLPPLASNTKDGSMILQHLAGQPAGLPHMPRPQAQAAGQGMHHALHQGGVSWPLPNAAPWAPQQQSFSQLQAALSAAATDTRLPPLPSGPSSKLTVDQRRPDAQPTVGSAAAGMHEGQAPQVDVQQMVGALHLLQQLQEVIGSLLVAQVQQQQAAPAPPPPAAPAYGQHQSQQQQQQLLSLLGGLAGGSQQAAAPPPPPPPQQQQQQEEGQHSQAMLQLLSQLAQQHSRQQQDQQQQQQLQHHQLQLPPPVVKPVPRSAAGSPAPGALPPGLEAQLLQAVAGGTGGEQGEQLHALLRRWARGLNPQSELA